MRHRSKAEIKTETDSSLKIFRKMYKIVIMFDISQHYLCAVVIDMLYDFLYSEASETVLNLLQYILFVV